MSADTRCRAGDLAIVVHEDPRCAHNLGRLVQVTAPAQSTTDAGAPCWHLRPVHAARWAAVAPGARRARLHRVDGHRVWQLPDAWLWPLTEDHIARLEEACAFTRMQAQMDRWMRPTGPSGSG